jgi:hypothetical protein
MEKDNCYKVLQKIFNDEIMPFVADYKKFRTNPNMSGKSSPHQSKPNQSDIDDAIIKLESAIKIINDCNNYVNNEYYNFLIKEKLSSLKADIEHGLDVAKRLSDATGFTKALDHYCDVFIDCYKNEYLPAEEVDILRRLGNANPEDEMLVIGQLLKSRSPYIKNRLYAKMVANSKGSFSEEVFSDAKKVLLDESQAQEIVSPDKSKRILKTIGTIGTGATLIITNIMIVVNGSSSEQGVASVSSYSLGVSQLVVGIGEWRKE